MGKMKLQVTTVQTRDGMNPRYDEDGRPMLKTTIVELKARKQLESINKDLPIQLKMKIKEVEVDARGRVVTAAPARQRHQEPDLTEGDDNQELETPAAPKKGGRPRKTETTE